MAAGRRRRRRHSRLPGSPKDAVSVPFLNETQIWGSNLRKTDRHSTEGKETERFHLSSMRPPVSVERADDGGSDDVPIIGGQRRGIAILVQMEAASGDERAAEAHGQQGEWHLRVRVSVPTETS
ncbi:uncharacterized protein LOC105785730 [Gossypium raimondii]|uniref:uncharacterized protein LOC105785730 n=1 Tax=Gossypium raimondii TaxID=29730 RepID=UPI00063AF2DC|nr:uncharacterized protein LOC105785730 [Gossypium raimondii]